jgi:uncharacterized protein involved in exopolysaccharide biosynthesis
MNMPSDVVVQDSQDEGLVIHRLWGKRWWILVSTFLFTGAATFAAYLMTPIYRASTVMISATRELNSEGSVSGLLGQVGSLASLAGITVGTGDSEVEEALAVLKSRQFTEKFISEKNLMPELFARKWDQQRERWRVSAIDQPTLGDGFKEFDENIRTAVRDKKTGLFILQIDWKDRYEAAAWANELVQRINAEMRTRVISNSEASMGFLQKELDKATDIGTREAIYRLIESQIKRRMLASATQEYAFRVIDKAMAPDVKDTVRPVKILIVLLGLVFGATFGCLAVLSAATFKLS